MDHFNDKIQGWDFGIPEIYRQQVAQAVDGSHFVEVGSWKGKSSAFMAVEIINSGKKIKFDCIDWWQSDNNIGYDDPYVKNGTLYEHFLENMKPVEGYFNSIKISSVEGSKLYADKSLDFVFIDAAHDYDNVKADILAWAPKIKKGGAIGGHDYNFPPVRQAVNECLQNIHDYEVCWLVII